jgi:hypothetical protein
MKKLANYLCLLVLSSLTCAVQAQSYSFTTFKDVYVKLPNDKKDVRSPTGGKAWGTEMNAGAMTEFPVGILGHSCTLIDMGSQSIQSEGSKGDSTSPLVYTLYYTGNGLVDRNYDPSKSYEELGPSISQVSSFTAGELGNRIFKIEYDNVKLKNSRATDSIFFQVWFYEGSNIIEMRYGPSSITTPKEELSPFSTKNEYTIGFVNFGPKQANSATEVLYLTGDPNNPQMNYRDHWVDDLFMHDYPKNGTVYRFIPTKTNDIQKKYAVNMEVFPNPATDVLYIKVDEDADAVLYDISGKIILEQELVAGQQSLAISGVNQGIYLLKVQTVKGIASKKILVH